jgi:hypothetical protein
VPDEIRAPDRRADIRPHDVRLHDIRIVRGSPTPEELAALVTVLASRPAQPTTDGSAPVSWWARSARPAVGLRGPGAWRASAMPR